MLKTFEGLQYATKSPSEYRLVDMRVINAGWNIGVDYIGPTLQWRLTVDSPKENKLTKCFLRRDQAFRIISNAIHDEMI